MRRDPADLVTAHQHGDLSAVDRQLDDLDREDLVELLEMLEDLASRVNERLTT